MQLTVMMRMASEWIHSGKGFVQGRNISKINVLPRSEKSGLFSFLGFFSQEGGTKRTPLENAVIAGLFAVLASQKAGKSTKKQPKIREKRYETYLPK